MFQFRKCSSADFFRCRIISWEKKQNKSKACFVKIQSSFIAYIFLKSWLGKFKCDKSLVLLYTCFIFPNWKLLTENDGAVWKYLACCCSPAHMVLAHYCAVTWEWTFKSYSRLISNTASISSQTGNNSQVSQTYQLSDTALTSVIKK